MVAISFLLGLLGLHSLACKIPDSLSLAEASVFPLCITTAAHGLFSKDYSGDHDDQGSRGHSGGIGSTQEGCLSQETGDISQLGGPGFGVSSWDESFLASLNGSSL